MDRSYELGRYCGRESNTCYQCLHGLYPPLADFITPTRRQVAAIRPGSNIIDNPALKRTMGLNSAISGDYMQSRAEEFSGSGGIIIGRSYWLHNSTVADRK
jgi:hypothetical protein